jgi:hypothetical protein
MWGVPTTGFQIDLAEMSRLVIWKIREKGGILNPPRGGKEITDLYYMYCQVETVFHDVAS